MRKILRVVGAFKPLANNVVIRFIVGFPVTIGTLQLSEYFYKNNFIFYINLHLRLPFTYFIN